MDCLRRGVLAALTLGLVACGGDAKPGPKATPAEALRAYCGDDYADVERRIDVILAQLDLTDKVKLVRGELSGEPAWYVPGLPALGVPAFAMVDGPRGVTDMVGVATAFPVEMARGATFDPDLERRVGAAIGHETRAYGRNVLLAPTMNVLAHPRWGRAQETYGEDSFHIGSMALGFVAGAQTEVPVTAKHFAVNNIENTRRDVDVTVDERTLREVFLPHFKRVVQEGHVASIMSAYNSVNGAHCSENTHLLREVLKDEWNFAGYVVSDWGGTEPNEVGYDHTIASAKAGLDLEMFVPQTYGNPLEQAVLSAGLSEAYVDDMVRRLIRARLCYALDTDPPVEDPSQVSLPTARALALEVAERSMVLLKNTGAALPIVRPADVVVTGPLANIENIGDTGSSNVNGGDVVTVLEGMMTNAGTASVQYVPTMPTSPGDQSLVSNADVVVVVVGLTAFNEGEAEIGAGDRPTLALAAEDLAWIHAVSALSNRVVVVIEGGSAITMNDFLPEVEAVVFAWYPGVEGGNALAHLLFGDVSPQGRLPIVFPAAEADLPPFDNVSLSVSLGYFYGYRHLDHTGTAPLFPFGAGLSYTTFAYSNLVVESTTLGEGDTIRVSVDVENTGARAARETVQVYVGATTSMITPRFARELRAFSQVDLAPAQKKTVSLEVPVASLGYWDTAANAFRVEHTTYRLEVGHSSGELPLMTSIEVVRPL